MIARTAVSPVGVAALVDRGASRAEVFARSQAICEALRAHGHLVFSSHDEREAMQASILHVHQQHREAGAMWVALIKQFVQARRCDDLSPADPAGVDGLASLEQLRVVWGPHTDVIAVPNDRAEALGVAETETSHLDAPSQIDVARIATVPSAASFRGMKATSDAGVIKHGESRERLWRDVLAPIARVSRRLVLVDRYVFSGLADAVHGGRGDTTFVAWLLERLDAEARDGCELTLIGWRGKPREQPSDGAGAAALVAQVFSPGGRLGKVEIIASQPATFLPHDRHISSSLNVGVGFPAGFGDFARSTITKREGVEFVYRWTNVAVEKMRESERLYTEDRASERIIVHTR